ncbi:Hormone-sensitive lipase [Seminavis robusta]|uniref:Hormone-sensitive lipase n=1 Tax=Seminavis robusta TaxID=568900 RepID=A0A9N8DJD3_9STRA|nr:Hormone-sensitive lipase [Seminavis robusta]|eukprot:Sro114_g056280.1 Hormone-sensitive lipase (770) ;mRNA; r:24838-27147
MATTTNRTNHYYYYACDAAQLLETCMDHLQTVVDLDRSTSNDGGGGRSSFQELQESLIKTERLLRHFFVEILPPMDDQTDDNGLASLASCVIALKAMMEQEREKKKQSTANGHHPTRNLSGPRHSRNSATDTLLFRLIVALQLCLVRIDDAHLVVAGIRRPKTSKNDPIVVARRRTRRRWLVRIGFCATVLGVTVYLLPTRKDDKYPSRQQSSLSLSSWNNNRETWQTLAKAGTCTFLCFQLAQQWKVAWMTSKLGKTQKEIQEWHQQWRLVEGSYGSQQQLHTLYNGNGNHQNSNSHKKKAPITDATKARRLIEYAQQHNNTTPPSRTFWDEGELRFLIVRKAMETYYSWTSADEDEPSHDLSSTARAMILSNSWGLVSRPGIKDFSLRASRFLKGASVADRIEIAGIPCFVISKYPCPELATAIQQYSSTRLPRRRMSARQLSTIEEDAKHEEDHTLRNHQKLFAAASDCCRQQDIILHCTAGGYFAHMIAFDLVYLLDWSASTGAVVVCPEFSLLPSHPFPVALQEVTKVYSTLVSGQATSALGFEVRRIAVTGESTGANLATALCVNLCLGGNNNTMNPDTFFENTNLRQHPSAAANKSNGHGGLVEDRESAATTNDDTTSIRLPDALMLSCAVLNMSLELSHSRVMGTEDPVLPSGVLSAISDAYLPPYLGIRKTHILASPLFAPNSILARFPPTLLFASSNDPLLDDSVEFNQRLRSLNVQSEIRAVQNMPHAYWGLGMAGFPEAKKVHKEAQEWLATKLTRA